MPVPDLTNSAIVSGIISLLVPVAKSLLQGVGEIGNQIVKDAYTALRKKFQAEHRANAAFDNFLQDPDLYKAVLEKVLNEALQGDKEFARQLEGILKKQASETTRTGQEVGTVGSGVFVQKGKFHGPVAGRDVIIHQGPPDSKKPNG